MLTLYVVHEYECVIIIVLCCTWFLSVKSLDFFENYFHTFRYAGVLFGFTNTFSTLPGIIAPYVVTALTPDVSLFYLICYKFIVNCTFNDHRAIATGSQGRFTFWPKMQKMGNIKQATANFTMVWVKNVQSFELRAPFQGTSWDLSLAEIL